SENSIFKIQKENNYVSIDNKVFTDESLSWKAKGILGYLLSRPDDWQVIIQDVVNQSVDGRDSVMTGLNELEEKKYIHKHRRRNAKGHFIGWVYYVFENPVMNKASPTLENPTSDNPISDNPKSEKPKL